MILIQERWLTQFRWAPEIQVNLKPGCSSAQKRKQNQVSFFFKIEEGFTSFTSSCDPEIRYDFPGMRILRDEKISPEMGGSGSGNTLSILKKYESWNWTYNQRHWEIFRVSRPTFWSPRLAIFSFVIDCKCVIARVARMWTFGNGLGYNGNESSATPYWSCTVKYAMCLVRSVSRDVTFLRASAVAAKLCWNKVV